MIVAALVITPLAAPAATLLFGEAQLVGGYTSATDEGVWYSNHPDDAMQKPGAGFDFIHRFSGDSGDIATVAVQGRAVYDEMEESNVQFQLYNAYLRFRTPAGYLWAGHNRPALGISAYLDSHAALLPALSMKGIGYDRDWGGGYSYEFSSSDIALSLTTGSGMPLYYDEGNYLASARYSFGVLSQDNFNIGISGAYGEIIETMGYERMMDGTMPFVAGGVDANLVYDRYELKLEFVMGEKEHESFQAYFARAGVNFLEENRLTFEVQSLYLKYGHTDGLELYAGARVLATSSVTLRTMYQYVEMNDDHRVIGQLYWYGSLL